jgi:hypothetical protein
LAKNTRKKGRVKGSFDNRKESSVFSGPYAVLTEILNLVSLQGVDASVSKMKAWDSRLWSLRYRRESLFSPPCFFLRHFRFHLLDENDQQKVTLRKSWCQATVIRHWQSFRSLTRRLKERDEEENVA